MSSSFIFRSCTGNTHDGVTQFTNFSYSQEPVTNSAVRALLDNNDFPCTPNRTYTLTLGSRCFIDFKPDGPVATLICPGTTGYVNPKYVVVGVTYVPPGPNSFVQYSATSSFGTTTSLSDSFKSNVTWSASLSAEHNIGGWFDGKLTISGSTSAEQTLIDSSSTTLSIKNLFSNSIRGTQDAFSPINHDFDIIWLWLNPLQLFTVFPNPPGLPTVLAWNGYGFDVTDQPAMDIWPIEVGYLNGHFGALPFQDASVLARSWAANQVWPTGEDPGLTSTDFANILRADPFADPNYSVVLNGTASPATTEDGRFTIATGISGSSSNFLYRQPAPGSLPLTQTLTNTYTSMSTLGHSSKYETVVGWGIEASLSGGFFGVTFKAAVARTSKVTHTHESGSLISRTGEQVDTASITGPPCGASTPPCVPVYMGPPEFDIYQDNVFGAFMFNPAH
jgi:hypothetical protein